MNEEDLLIKQFKRHKKLYIGLFLFFIIVFSYELHYSIKQEQNKIKEYNYEKQSEYESISKENIKYDKVQNDKESVEALFTKKTQKSTSSDETEPIYKRNGFVWNPDTLKNICTGAQCTGFLYSRNSALRYAVVQGTDNEYYLNHDLTGRQSFGGSLFLDCRADNQFNQQNAVIYGHNLKNGTMFGSLKLYNDESYAKQNEMFDLYTDKNEHFEYRVFAVFKTTEESCIYRTDFTEKQMKDYLKNSMKESVIHNYTFEPTGKEHILTLSTCVNNDNTRQIVQLVRIE